MGIRTRSRARNRVTTVVLMVLLAGLASIAMVGCGGDDSAADTTSTAAVQTTAASATTVSAAPASSDTTTAPDTTEGADAPTGEPGATVSVASTNGAYPKDNAPDWGQIESVVAFRSSSMGVASLFVVLATYDIGVDSLASYRDVPNPPEGEGRVDLVLTRTVGGSEEPPMVTGTYDFSVGQGQAELTGEAGIYVPGGTKVSFQQSGLENDVQVTAVSDTQVSGTFKIKDKWSEISGTFTAPVK